MRVVECIKGSTIPLDNAGAFTLTIHSDEASFFISWIKWMTDYYGNIGILDAHF